LSEPAHDEAGAAQAGAGHERSGHGGAAQLVRMANDIGNFFRAEPVREEAIAGISNHISKYWTQRMRDKLAALLQEGDVALDELPREALRRITPQAPKGEVQI
jgi:formate dehydrogenase subunit delta